MQINSLSKNLPCSSGINFSDSVGASMHNSQCSIKKIEQNATNNQSKSYLDSIGHFFTVVWTVIVNFFNTICCCYCHESTAPKGFHYKITDLKESEDVDVKNAKRFDLYYNGKKTDSHLIIGTYLQANITLMKFNLDKKSPNPKDVIQQLFYEILDECNYDSIYVNVNKFDDYESFKNMGFEVTNVDKDDTLVINDNYPLKTDEKYIGLISAGLNELFFTPISSDTDLSQNLYVQEAIQVCKQCDEKFDSKKFISEIRNNQLSTWETLIQKPHEIKYHKASYIQLLVNHLESLKKLQRYTVFPHFFWMKYEKK